jgi:hypothetical protein
MFGMVGERVEGWMGEKNAWQAQAQQRHGWSRPSDVDLSKVCASACLFDC